MNLTDEVVVGLGAEASLRDGMFHLQVPGGHRYRLCRRIDGQWVMMTYNHGEVETHVVNTVLDVIGLVYRDGQLTGENHVRSEVRRVLGIGDV